MKFGFLVFTMLGTILSANLAEAGVTRRDGLRALNCIRDTSFAWNNDVLTVARFGDGKSLAGSILMICRTPLAQAGHTLTSWRIANAIRRGDLMTSRAETNRRLDGPIRKKYYVYPDDKDVSSQTVAKVRKAARDLGYYKL